jgi:hypothetical protein
MRLPGVNDTSAEVNDTPAEGDARPAMVARGSASGVPAPSAVGARSPETEPRCSSSGRAFAARAGRSAAAHRGSARGAPRPARAGEAPRLAAARSGAIGARPDTAARAPPSEVARPAGAEPSSSTVDARADRRGASWARVRRGSARRGAATRRDDARGAHGDEAPARADDGFARVGPASTGTVDGCLNEVARPPARASRIPGLGGSSSMEDDTFPFVNDTAARAGESPSRVEGSRCSSAARDARRNDRPGVGLRPLRPPNDPSTQRPWSFGVHAESKLPSLVPSPRGLDVFAAAKQRGGSERGQGRRREVEMWWSS